MTIEELLKNNSVSSALYSGMYSLFYDAVLEVWVVKKGAGKKRSVLLECNSFDEAFKFWVKHTNQIV